MDYFILAIVCFALQLASHYFPWRALLGKQLSRPAAYIIGTLVHLVPWSIWMWMRGSANNEVYAILGAWVAVVSSGVAVLGSRLVDAAIHGQKAAQALREIEALYVSEND